MKKENKERKTKTDLSLSRSSLFSFSRCSPTLSMSLSRHLSSPQTLFVSLSCSLPNTSRKIQAKRISPSVAATVMMEFKASLFRLPLPGTVPIFLDFGFLKVLAVFLFSQFFLWLGFVWIASAVPPLSLTRFPFIFTFLGFWKCKWLKRESFQKRFFTLRSAFPNWWWILEKVIWVYDFFYVFVLIPNWVIFWISSVGN